jgi:hypothetical protein
MNEYVKGELMSGVNQYECSTCNAKVDALSRACIKTLPPTLMVQLKRFSFDYQTMQPLKNNDHFEFPAQFDFGPYTADGLRRNETARDSPSNDEDPADDTASATECSVYQLQGVVVHMGTATAGHYYSYARTRETPETRANNTANQWYKFNDESIDPVALDADLFEEQFYGGDTVRNSMYGVVDKNYSAYILVYERIDVLEYLKTGGQSLQQLHRQLSRTTSADDDSVQVDSSTAEVQPSSPSRAGLELEILELDIPPRLQQEIDIANLRFGFNSELLSSRLTEFVAGLVREAVTNPGMVKAVSQLAINMFFKVACHLRGNAAKERRARLHEIQEPMIQLLRSNQGARREACHILAQHPEWLIACLVDSKLLAVRSVCAELVLYVLLLHGDMSVTPLDADWLAVLGHLGNCLPTFQAHMDHCGPFIKLVADFMRGPHPQGILAINSGLVDSCMNFIGTLDEQGKSVWKYEDHNRLDELHTALCCIVRICDLAPLQPSCDVVVNEVDSLPFYSPSAADAECLGFAEEALLDQAVQVVAEEAEKENNNLEVAEPAMDIAPDAADTPSDTGTVPEVDATPNFDTRPEEGISLQDSAFNTAAANITSSASDENANTLPYGPEPEPSQWGPSGQVSAADLAAIAQALEDDDDDDDNDSIPDLPDAPVHTDVLVIPAAGNDDTLPSYETVAQSGTYRPLPATPSYSLPMNFVEERTENPLMLAAQHLLCPLPVSMAEGAIGNKRWYLTMIIDHLLINNGMPRLLTYCVHDNLGLSMFVLQSLLQKLRDVSYHGALKAIATILQHRDMYQKQRFAAIMFGTNEFSGLVPAVQTLLQTEPGTAYKYFKMIPQLMASVPVLEQYMRERAGHWAPLKSVLEALVPTDAVHSVTSNCYGGSPTRLQRTTSFSNTISTAQAMVDGVVPLVDMSLLRTSYASAAV